MYPLENTLLSTTDVVHAIRSLGDRKLHDGYKLVNKIETTREKILVGSSQVWCRDQYLVLMHMCSNSNWASRLLPRVPLKTKRNPRKLDLCTIVRGVSVDIYMYQEHISKSM